MTCCEAVVEVSQKSMICCCCCFTPFPMEETLSSAGGERRYQRAGCRTPSDTTLKEDE